MRIGTRSVLFGAHAVWLHGFVLVEAWRRLYGVPWDPRLWAAFFLHDIGYWNKTDLEGASGETHVYAGARIMTALFGSAWGEFCLRHSRYWARKHGRELSRLAAADKLAFVLVPWWLYLPMTRATGELAEYMAVSQERQAGDHSFTESERALLASGNARSWLIGLQAYTRRWVEEHKDRCLRVEDVLAEERAPSRRVREGGETMLRRVRLLDRKAWKIVGIAFFVIEGIVFLVVSTVILIYGRDALADLGPCTRTTMGCPADRPDNRCGGGCSGSRPTSCPDR